MTTIGICANSRLWVLKLTLATLTSWFYSTGLDPS